VPHRPEPSAPIDQQAVAVDAQHAALDLVGAADRQAVAGADVGHGVGPPAGASIQTLVSARLSLPTDIEVGCQNEAWEWINGRIHRVGGIS
jgi:hypothetical protein